LRLDIISHHKNEAGEV